MLAKEKKTDQKNLANMLRIMLKIDMTQDSKKKNRKAGCSQCSFHSLLPLGRLQRFSFLSLSIASSCTVSTL